MSKPLFITHYSLFIERMSMVDNNIATLPANLTDDLDAPPLSLGRMAWLRFRKHKAAMFGLITLIGLFAFSFGGALFISEAEANQTDTSMRLQPPSWEHPFGTDTIGRDILARAIYGGQISLMIGLFAVSLQLVMGIIIGALAGFYPGWLDSMLMRMTEAILTIPLLFLLLVMSKFFGGRLPDMTLFGRSFSGSVVIIIGIIGFTTWPTLARIVRAQFLSLKENEFVLAARATGTPNGQIIFRHILPNTIAPIVVAATLGVASAILTEAYISFLGLGVQAPTPTWGNMITGAASYIEQAPWLWFFPGMLILLTVLSINFVGDGLRDALDPKTK
jgi:peptide/nickel transport system permease protein